MIDQLTAKVDELESKLAAQNEAEEHKEENEVKSNAGSEDETDEDEEDDYMEDLPVPLANKKKGPRASVSAESFGTWNKKSDFKARVVPKSEESKNKIREKLSQSFMFSALEAKEQTIVVDAMEERKAGKNDVVIKEGDEGAELFVVEKGTLSCTKIFKGNTEPTFLKTYQPGEAFGELALLYNAPRAATIFANEDCILWALDRNTFNHIVKDAASKRRDKYEQFLSQV